MQTRDYLSLLKHMEWADASIWKVVLALPGRQPHGGLLERLHHLHGVQWVYLQVWRGEALRVPELAELPDLAAVARWARPYYAELHDFAKEVESDRLARTVEFPWAAEVSKRFGSAGPLTLGESMLQVVLHSTYHRGQVATSLRELGATPPLTDFVAWIWKMRPEPEWTTEP